MGTISYGVQLNHMSRCLDPTVRVYRHTVRYLIDIVFLHYEEIEGLSPKAAQRHIEQLVHSTAYFPAAYPAFDRRFYKMPCYLRRAAISTAIGKVSSYRKLVSLWEDGGRKGKRPHMDFNQDMMPCFYKGNMFDAKDGVFRIKAFIRNDWVWLPVSLRKSDLDYIRKHCAGMKECAPVLRKAHHKYLLQFAFQYSVTDDTPRFVKDVDVQKIVGVDLGLNTDAVCSSMLRDGTVADCRFIDSPVEKDRLYTLLNVIKGTQQHGSRKEPRLWRFVNNYNREIAVKTASGIVRFAREQGAQVIVFENLSVFRKKARGSKKQRIALWRKQEIQARTAQLAQRFGIRTTKVCAWNTSRLAFDGSGKVIRDADNYALCTFATGKRYNCDLSASKNIGARYFIRAIKKSMPETAWSSVQAKVPELGARTRCTLASLIRLAAEAAAIAGDTGSPVLPAAAI